jgi:hypothetical protein
VYAWPCEVDVAPLRAETATPSLEKKDQSAYSLLLEAFVVESEQARTHRRVRGRAGARGCVVLLLSLAVVLIFGGVSPSATYTRPFSPRNYPLGTHPFSIATGDLNGDRALDLATANFAGTVSLLLNQGDGSFAPKVDIRVQSQDGVNHAIAIGDLNGDAKADLVTANYLPFSVSVLLNRGDGSFQDKVDYETGRFPSSVAIGDLNADGKPDLVTANQYGNSVSVLLNKGDGSFQPKRAYPADLGAAVVAIADLNGDAKPDLATANRLAGTVSVLLGKGDGSFQNRVNYRTASVNSGPESVAVGDLDGHGLPDLATANGGTNTVSVFLNRGDGSFLTKPPFLTDLWPRSIAIGDLNGDGKQDLAVANDESHEVSLFVNKGRASFRPTVDFRTGRIPVSVTIGDLNRDGKLDAATANAFGNSISVLPNASGRCVVPEVTREVLPAARQRIARANCRVGKVRRALSKRVKKDRVISQTPNWGVISSKGAKVNLVVSRGRH